MQEFDIIKQYFLPLANNPASLSLADDTAIIKVPKEQNLVVSKDLFIENIHFLRSDGGYKIAYKLLCANISDLAASGAKPLYYMLGFSKNNHCDQYFYQQFCLALQELQQKFNISLIGGDTVFSDKLCFSITIFGLAKNTLQRSLAQDGDLIFVSNYIGDAGLGLATIKAQQEHKSYAKTLLNAHYFPQPRIDFALALNELGLSKAAIDISDGLIADLKHMCLASNIYASIFFNQIPISKDAKNFLQDNPQHNPLNLLASGDDYELIFSANPDNQQKIIDLAKKMLLNISCIGYFHQNNIYNEQRVLLFQNQSQPLKLINYQKTGYQH